MATDLLGFPLPGLTELQKSERALCDEQENQGQGAWSPYIEADRVPSEAQRKELIRKGLPPACRTWVWMNASTAAKKKAAVAVNYYSIMVTAGASSPFLAEIDQDVQATFQTHPWFQGDDGRAALKRVLTAYSVHNDRLGYTRAMANVVGLLLLAMNRNEENTFWLLASLVEDILYPGTYSRNLEGCQVEMRALDELVSHKLPVLHAHLVATECDISLIATDWYLGLFSTSLPAETVCRVWDGLFSEGPKVLFRTALALLKLNEEMLLKCDNAGDIVISMRKAAAATHQRERLMAVAFEGIGGLPMATIDKFRDAKAREVDASLRERGSVGDGGAGPAQGGTGSSVLGIKLSSSQSERLDQGAAKVKEGFGKFMKWTEKAANKVADKMATTVEKMGIKDDEPAAHPHPPAPATAAPARGA